MTPHARELGVDPPERKFFEREFGAQGFQVCYGLGQKSRLQKQTHAVDWI